MTRAHVQHCKAGRRLPRAMVAAVLASTLPPAIADDDTAVDGYGRIDGRYCALSARLVLDDGRHFEVDATLAQRAAVEVRGAAIAASPCGHAPRLASGFIVVPARPAIELALPARDWPKHAADIDVLMRRFPHARLRLRVLDADRVAAENAVLQIATVLLQRPDVMARTTIAALPPTPTQDGARGWRVSPDAFEPSRSVHADSAADVARLLATAR